MENLQVLKDPQFMIEHRSLGHSKLLHAIFYENVVLEADKGDINDSSGNHINQSADYPDKVKFP